MVRTVGSTRAAGAWISIHQVFHSPGPYRPAPTPLKVDPQPYLIHLTFSHHLVVPHTDPTKQNVLEGGKGSS